MAAFDTVEQARVLAFKANVVQLYQQKPSKLRGKIREEAVTGKAYFFERLDKVAAVKKTARHSDTVTLDPAHSRRMVVPVDYVWNALVDMQDKIRLLIDPNSEYAIAAANALRRAFDIEAIAAFDASANGGEDGSTAVTFASEAGGDNDFTAAAVTIPNLLKVKVQLDNSDVDSDERYIIASPDLQAQLMKASTPPLASNVDYNSVKVLMSGEVNTYLGFEWTWSTLLSSPAAGQLNFFAWQKNSMGIAVAKDIIARLSERPDKDYAVQTYAAMSMGATRIQGAGVVRSKLATANT